MFKSRHIFTSLLIAMSLLSTAYAQSPNTADQLQPASVNIYRDLVRFAVQDGRHVRVELFDLSGNKIFDSGFVEGNSLDWFTQDQQGQPVESSLYSYTLSVKDKSGKVSLANQGNVIIDRERQNLSDAPPDAKAGGHHKKGLFEPQTDGVFDVNATGGSYNINAARMGVGTANPLVRLHVGSGAVPPVTLGATLLVEDGAATSMVMKSTSGGEMFFFQNNVAGVFGTASNQPISIRTSNLDRVFVDTNGNVGIGTQSPTSKLTVAGAIESTTGTIMGSMLNASTQFNIGGNRVLSVTGFGNTFTGVGAGSANTGTANSFFGNQAGQANTSGFNNSFFGSFAGINNTTGSANSFFGLNAGLSNTTGVNNSFFGQQAGRGNTTANNNSFFGNLSGLSNTTGGNNSFFGNQSGQGNTTGLENSFFGTFAGISATTGSSNSFFGQSAGSLNTTGTGNTFVGQGTGQSNTSENNNTLIGNSSNGAAGITNATAIGSRASVTQSNSLVLGSINGVNGAAADVNVGIGITAPKAKLHVKGGDVFIANPNSLIITSPNGSCFQIRVSDAGALSAASVPCPN